MKKFIFAIASICMMAASVCFTSCSKDNANDPVDPTPTPAPVVKDFTDTLKISASISPELKELLKLHYYEVDNNGEKEVAEIPTIVEGHKAKGTYNRGIKITSEYTQGENEAIADYRDRVKVAIMAAVEASDKKCTEIPLKGYYKFIYSSTTKSSTKSTEWGSLEEYLELNKDRGFTEEEAFVNIAMMVLFEFRHGLNFAYTTVIADKFDDCSSTAYTWKNY